MKEQEREAEQDHDNMLYTYARDNEQKVIAKSTPSENNCDFHEHQYPRVFSKLLAPLSRPISNETLARRQSYFVPSPSDDRIDHIDHCIPSPVLLDLENDREQEDRTPTVSLSKTNSDVRQRIWIVNSLESLRSLTKQPFITLIHNNSIVKIPSVDNRMEQSATSRFASSTNERKKIE